MIVSMTGDDTIQINGQTLTDFADGDTAVLEFPQELVNVKTGKDGNSIYGFNNMGRQCTFVLRLIIGGADDQFLNALFQQWILNPPAFPLMTGEFIKNVGDGKGNISQIIYQVSGGAFHRGMNAKENADGVTDQSVVVYSMIFSNAPRSIT